MNYESEFLTLFLCLSMYSFMAFSSIELALRVDSVLSRTNFNQSVHSLRSTLIDVLRFDIFRHNTNYRVRYKCFAV